jgi:hypothetical protein
MFLRTWSQLRDRGLGHRTAWRPHLKGRPLPRPTPYRLDARNSTRGRGERWQTGEKKLWEKKTKPPGTSGSLAFPCERADHLEVSCSERYPRPKRPSNGSENFTFHRMWTTVWKRCALSAAALWTKLVIGSPHAEDMWKPLVVVVSCN